MSERIHLEQNTDEWLEYFSYDPATGDITRIKKTSNRGPAGVVVGTKCRNGYLKIGFMGKDHYCHRVAWLLYHGEWPEEVDHINGDRSDNRIDNLRSVTRRDNCRNTKARSSHHPGIYWARRKKKYQVQIHNTHVGYFDKESDALAARIAAEKDHGYHNNHGRAL